MSDSNRLVVAWLTAVAFAVFAMIVVGGVTRLTESGLSMVDWQPIMGIMPPNSEVEWQAAFDAYKAYPQYLQVNQHMDLAGFKEIFYWEYVHRVLGRLIGVIFFVPMVLLWWLGKIEPRFQTRLLGALFLGGAQGLLGWYMVKSGLVDMPRVSHFRLAAHLLLAMFILAYLFWLILDHLGVEREAVTPGMKRFNWMVATVLALQLLYGAFTAGIRAGYGYNTFPLMDGKFMADAVFFMEPWWINLFESSATIQFVHRWLAAGLLVLTFFGWLRARGQAPAIKWAAAGLFGAVLLQFAIGILTLIKVVPIGLASIHQGWACVVLLASVYQLYLMAGLPEQVSAPAGASAQ